MGLSGNKVFILSWMLCFSCPIVFGQINHAIFDGSNGDGYTAECFLIPSNNLIYDGSLGDGYASLCAEQITNNQIYDGSVSDGYAAFCAEQISNNFIYDGSTGDGYDAFCFEIQANNLIFEGGNGDGYGTFCFEPSVNNSIYDGSTGDGYDLFCFEPTANNSIFDGGEGDGYTVYCYEQTAVNPIFGGSFGDGYSMDCSTITPIQLPIEVLVFDGILEGDDAILRWVVSQEIDNDYFVLERSIDGFNFEEVVVIASLGNTSDPREYRYRDFIRPLFGHPAVYYQLKQVDFDGQYEYTHIIVLNLPVEEEVISYVLFPNPAQHKIFLRYAGPVTGNVQLEIVDNMGRLLIRSNASAIDLLGGFEIDIDKLPAGAYHIRIRDEVSFSVKTFMKVYD